MPEDTLGGPFGFTVSDIETSAGSLTLSASSSDPAVVPSGNITFSGSGRNRFVTVQPATNQNGTAQITVVLHDTAGGASSNTLSLTSNPVNGLPFISSIAHP